MTGIVPGSLYEQLIEEGILKGIEEGKEEGIYKKSVMAIRNMTLKKVESAIIAEFLNEPLISVKTIQAQLKHEKKIITLLKKKNSIKEIAKKLEVTVWLVEVIQELNFKKKK